MRNSQVFYRLLSFSGYINSFIQLLSDFLIKKVSPETYKQLHDTNPLDAAAAKPQQSSAANHLISNANQMNAEVNFTFTVKQ